MTEDSLNELVRDMTKAGSIPKSEARRRIEGFLKEERVRTIELIEHDIKDLLRTATEENDKSSWSTCAAILYQLKEMKK